MMNTPRISETYWPYFQKLLTYHNLEFYPVSDNPDQWSGNLQKIKNFDQYNSLIDINLCFSTRPSKDLRDRTGQTKMPFQMAAKPWLPPSRPILDFEKICELRVYEFEACQQKINLLWSGGIDSTAMLVSFLKHSTNLQQLRVLYSIQSRKENPYFFLLLQNYPQIQTIEIGGDYYMEEKLDGIFVGGNTADYILASLDESFFDAVGYIGLNQPWQSLFFKKTNNVEFVNYCEEFFSRSQRPINTVLEARWWFYMICKINTDPRPMELFAPADVVFDSFFDSQMFEDYMYVNTDKILPNKNYSSYKKFIKDYIREFDHNQYYSKNKLKENSGQLNLYRKKKAILHDTQTIMYLSDNTRIFVDSLPFLSEISYRQKYGHDLDYLFST